MAQFVNTNANDNANIPYSKFRNCDRYMLLQIKPTAEMYNAYVNAAEAHNTKMLEDPHPDAGVDLFTTEEIECFRGKTNKVNLHVTCAARMICESGKTYPTGFYTYPRSSTGSKTPLRLANSVGIIDSGYRGELMAFFDYAESYNISQYIVPKFTKLIQVCAPSLVPIYVEVVTSLGETTTRGEGGFGSTGV